MNCCSLRKDKKKPVCSAVIVAAGSSQRMGTDKIMMKLGAMPVLARTILAFENNAYIDEIIIVTKTEKLEEIADLCHKNGLNKVKRVVSGGATRMAEYVAIHDGARPLVSQELIKRTVEAALKYRAAVPAVECADTLKVVDKKGFITATVDRSVTRRVQTPQVFEADLIKGALTKAVEEGLPLTDDCSAMDMMGVKTFAVEGEPENLKITTPDDLVVARAIVQNRGEWNANRTWV